MTQNERDLRQRQTAYERGRAGPGAGPSPGAGRPSVSPNPRGSMHYARYGNRSSQIGEYPRGPAGLPPGQFHVIVIGNPQTPQT